MTRDASLSLLDRIVDDAMDPGYRRAAEQPVARSRTRLGSAVMAGLVAVLAALAAAAVLQVRAGAPSDARTRTDLSERVSSISADLDRLERQVGDARAELVAAQAEALEGSTRDRSLAGELAALESAVGASATSGPGLTVTLDDGPPAPAGEGGPDLARVLDSDVQLTVNGLFAAGAEAVSVNGERITVLSPIRAAGEAVLVGFRPLTPPYRVVAVGPGSMADRFVASAARSELAQLEATYGMVVEVDRDDDLTVPGRNDLRPRYAQKGESK